MIATSTPSIYTEDINHGDNIIFMHLEENFRFLVTKMLLKQTIEINRYMQGMNGKIS